MKAPCPSTEADFKYVYQTHSKEELLVAVASLGFTNLEQLKEIWALKDAAMQARAVLITVLADLTDETAIAVVERKIKVLSGALRNNPDAQA